MTGTGTAKKEDEIETVDILVFDMSKTPAVFLEWVSATGVTQDLADNSTVSFSAVLSPTTASTCIVVVANKELDNIVSGFTKGATTKVEAMEKMLHTQTGKWLADGSDNWWVYADSDVRGEGNKQNHSFDGSDNRHKYETYAGAY